MTPREALRSDLAQIASRYGLSLDEATDRCRARPRPQARAEMWSMLRDAGWSYPEIAAHFNCDHTTIILGVRKHRASHPDDARSIGEIVRPIVNAVYARRRA